MAETTARLGARSRRRQSTLGFAAAAAAMLAVSAPPAQAHIPILYALGAKAFGVLGAQALITDALATRAYAKAQRAGTCEERRARLMAMLPDTLRLARLALDIYGHGADIKADGAGVVELGNGVRAYYAPTGKRYAEVHVDDARHEVVVVFQGTRLAVGGDVSTDIGHFIGIETEYYKWASALVARVVHEHPGWRITATGHSLGGGLVIDAMLRNPGVRGVAFNPSGLPWTTWLVTGRAERLRTAAALTVIATRNAHHIEPLTAVSLAHRTVLPGQMVLVETGAIRPLVMHSQVTLVASLEHVAADQAAGTACDGVLGPPPK